MKLILIAVGRLKAGPERELCDRYAERLRLGARAVGVASVSQVEISESPQRRAEDRMAEEARAILAATPPDAALMLFDERGAAIDSAGFAGLLRRQREAGVAALAAAVGGPDGLAPELREKARHVLSFGRMTMPHQIIRALVFEQFYRATTILTGHPYHRA